MIQKLTGALSTILCISTTTSGLSVVHNMSVVYAYISVCSTAGLLAQCILETQHYTFDILMEDLLPCACAQPPKTTRIIIGYVAFLCDSVGDLCS